MTPPLTTDEIVIETVRHYLSDYSRFAYNNGFCHYVIRDENENEKNCAVGRCLNPDGKERFGSFRGGIITVRKTIREENPEKSLDDYLLPLYRGHSESFWSSLQAWHDSVAQTENRDKNSVSWNWLKTLFREGYISKETLQTLRDEFPFK